MPFAEDDTDETVISEGPLLLVINQQRDIRKSVRNLFQDDFQILEAADGQDGLNKAIVHIPDLIICDETMPVLDGPGFYKLLKTNEATSHIPVMMLSSDTAAENDEKPWADEWLSKPLDPAQVRAGAGKLMSLQDMKQQHFDLHVADPESADGLFIEKIKNILTQNNEADEDQLHRALNMTSGQFSRKLKAITGLTPVELLSRYRSLRA